MSLPVLIDFWGKMAKRKNFVFKLLYFMASSLCFPIAIGTIVRSALCETGNMVTSEFGRMQRL
jgi:hypothetical protein